MSLLKKSLASIGALLLVLSLMGCEQAEQAKQSASDMVNQSLGDVKQAVGLGSAEGEKSSEEGGEKEEFEEEEKDD